MFVRLTISYAEFQPVLELVSNKSQKLVIYEHEQDEEVSRTHIHMYIVGWQFTKQYFKDICKRIKSFDKSDWAISESYKDSTGTKRSIDTGCITYMSKGKLDSSFVKGFTREELDTLKGGWTDPPSAKKQSSMSRYVVKESPNESKKRQNDLIDEMVTDLEEKGYVGEASDGSYRDLPPDELVVDIILRVLNRNRVIFSRYKVRDYYDTIMSRSYATSFRNNVLKFVRSI